MVESLERLTFVIVDGVPTIATAEPNKLYLVDTNHDGMYEEYILADVDGEPTIVELGPVVDLSGYYDKIQIDNLLLTKQNVLSWDNTIAANGTNPVVSGVIYSAISKLINDVTQLENGNLQLTTVDGTTSVIQTDTTVTNTNKLVQSKAVYAAIQQLEQAMAGIHIELTQAQYDALQTVDPNVEYFITDAVAEGDFSDLENRLQAMETQLVDKYSKHNIYTNSGNINPNSISIEGITDYEFIIVTTMSSGGSNQTIKYSLEDIVVEADLDFPNGTYTTVYTVGSNALSLKTDSNSIVYSIDGYKENVEDVKDYTEVVLFERQSNATDSHDITLSDSILNYDAICVITNAKGFLNGTYSESSGEGYSTTVPVSEILRHNGMSITLGGSDISANSYTKYFFDTASPTTMVHEATGSGAWAQVIRTVIGIKYSQSQLLPQEDYTETVLWENDSYSFPESGTFGIPYTEFDAVAFYLGGAAQEVDRDVEIVPTSCLAINTEHYLIISSHAAWFKPTSDTTWVRASKNGSINLIKIVGIKYGKSPAAKEIYSTIEQKIGKWLDGKDLFQRTFEVTGLTNGAWNNNVLGTSNIEIKSYEGQFEWYYNGMFNRYTSLDYYVNSSDFVATQNSKSDLVIKPNRTETGLTIQGAIITIKYTKTS